jgi:hypothetical protein
VVPSPLQAQIVRFIAGQQVDPRQNQNPPKAWKILAHRAVIAVLKAQGKTDAMNDELDRLARLDPKFARAPGAKASTDSTRSGPIKRTGERKAR